MHDAIPIPVFVGRTPDEVLEILNVSKPNPPCHTLTFLCSANYSCGRELRVALGANPMMTWPQAQLLILTTQNALATAQREQYRYQKQAEQRSSRSSNQADNTRTADN